MGECRFQAGDYAAARDHFHRCEDRFDVRSRLEICCRELGDYKMAYYYAKLGAYFGMVMVSTISRSVSLRSDTALMPAAWIRARDWVRLFRKPPRLTREACFFP